MVVFLGTIYNTICWVYSSLNLNDTHSHITRFKLRYSCSMNILPGKNEIRINKRYSIKIPICFHLDWLPILTVICYIIIMIIACTINYDLSEPNNMFKTKINQILVYAADKTGILAIIQLPLITLFSARNNPLIFITGWSYKKFNFFHKWISRITTILILLHAIFYVLHALKSSDYVVRWSLTKWQCANYAIICCLYIITLSFKLVRNASYEFFKISHKILVLLFLMFIWLHCKTLGWTMWIYYSAFIWFFEVILRMAKIIRSGGLLFAECRVLNDTNDTDIIQLKIPYSGWWKYSPGNYVYIIFMKRFFESHPFSIINPKREEENIIKLKIKKNYGLSKKLIEYVSSKNGECTLPVFVEGPYGNPLPIYKHEVSIFIAGGVGFSMAYSHAIDLARIEGLQSTSIIFIWVCHNIEFIEEYRNELIELEKCDNLIVKVFCTSRLITGDIETNSESSGNIQPPNQTMQFEKELENTYHNVGVKPDLRAYIASYLEVLKEKKSLAVLTCGPYSMVHDVRLSLQDYFKSDLPNKTHIDYFEGDLSW